VAVAVLLLVLVTLLVAVAVLVAVLEGLGQGPSPVVTGSTLIEYAASHAPPSATRSLVW
jgi:hypothetical protein